MLLCYFILFSRLEPPSALPSSWLPARLLPFPATLALMHSFFTCTCRTSWRIPSHSEPRTLPRPGRGFSQCFPRCAGGPPHMQLPSDTTTVALLPAGSPRISAAWDQLPSYRHTTDSIAHTALYASNCLHSLVSVKILKSRSIAMIDFLWFLSEIWHQVPGEHVTCHLLLRVAGAAVHSDEHYTSQGSRATST